jgi:hypothetical protein
MWWIMTLPIQWLQGKKVMGATRASIEDYPGTEMLVRSVCGIPRYLKPIGLYLKHTPPRKADGSEFAAKRGDLVRCHVTPPV